MPPPLYLKDEFVKELFTRLKKERPEPKTDLEYINTYTLLVSVVLSAQSTDKIVNAVMRPLFETLKTPQDLLNFGIDAFKDKVKVIGLYNNKAKNIFDLSRILVEKFKGIVPDNREDLESLPGVGRKSANVILNVAFGKPTVAVDTHVFRVSHRLKLSEGKTPLAVEMDLLKCISTEFLNNAGHWLVLHGRYTCKAKKPLCEKCCLYDICEFQEKKPLER